MRYKWEKSVNLKGLTPEQQIRELEKLTEKVIERLPELKEKIMAFDDKSDDLYNLTPEEIRLFTKTYSSDIAEGIGTSEGLNDYYQQLHTYGVTPMEELEVNIANQRWESFKEHIKSLGNEEEYNYLLELESKMSESDKIAFTRSKYFFDGGDYNSKDFVKFINDYGISVGMAKLETFLESQRDVETQRRYYEKGVTRTKLGRPKKRGRPRKR